MDSSTPSPNILTGDLPIRSRKPAMQRQSEIPKQSAVTETSDPLDNIDTTPAQVPETPKKVAMNLQAENTEEGLSDTISASVGRRKPKRRRPKSKRGHGKPTGFEEYYAEGPITPAEHEELRKVFNPGRPFMDRIEDALARYQYQRRIEPERRNIFHKFLQYGGINAGQNFGQGVNDKDLQNMTSDQAMQARSQTSIQQERDKLEINFNKVVQGFLGSFFVRYFNPEDENGIKLATGTIRNFFTYLLYRDVCPEYEENLLEARKTCDLATVELSKNLQFVREALGNFNECCSIVFGNKPSEAAVETTGWHHPVSLDAGMTSELKAIMAGIFYAGTTDQAIQLEDMVHEDKIETRKILDIDGFEVLEVTPPPTSAAQWSYFGLSAIDPVGKITARSYRDPAKPDLDLSPAERQEWDRGKTPEYNFEFLIEESLLWLCYPGLKVLATVWEVNCGLHYFTDVISVSPTFYTVIANDLMLEWKWPKDLIEGEIKKSKREEGQS